MIAIVYSPFRTAGFSVVDYQIGCAKNILFELWITNSWYEPTNLDEDNIETPVNKLVLQVLDLF